MNAHRTARSSLAALALVAGAVASGCTDEPEYAGDFPENEPAAPAAEAAQQPPQPAGIADQPRPSLSGSKRAAQNTVDRIGQRQRELQEAMDDDG